MHSFKMSNFIVFSILIDMCDHHHSQILGHFFSSWSILLIFFFIIESFTDVPFVCLFPINPLHPHLPLPDLHHSIEL